jgi:hypothetical protein
MSYRKGLFFFQVLYSVRYISQEGLSRQGAVQTLVDEALSLVILFFVRHVNY